MSTLRYLRVVGDMGAVNLHACRDGIQQRVSSVRQQPGDQVTAQRAKKPCVTHACTRSGHSRL